MLALIDIAKALSEANRIRAFMLLRSGELCLCQIIDVLGLSYSTVSKHMSILEQAGLIEIRREGRWAFCSLPNGDVEQKVQHAMQWVIDHLDNDQIIQEDAERLIEVLKLPRECISKKHMKSSRKTAGSEQMIA